jgi:uncharacterized membrane protein
VSTPSFELPRRELAFREETRGFTLTFKRNCSISPAGLACVFAALALAAVAIAVGFALLGAWLILPFAGLEVLLLGAAFLLQARHATDYERVVLDGARLYVEVSDGERVARHEFDARALRVESDAERVVVRGPREAIVLGRHLDGESRAAFAAELRKRLRI